MDQAAADKDLRKEAYSALYCLNIAVEPNVARDVYDKVHAYIVSLQSQLSASEERVRKQLTIIRDRAKGELEDAETLVQARAGLQAIASYVESLLPSPPQVEEKK